MVSDAILTGNSHCACAEAQIRLYPGVSSRHLAAESFRVLSYDTELDPELLSYDMSYDSKGHLLKNTKTFDFSTGKVLTSNIRHENIQYHQIPF